jgi:diphosphomevalonate decarboxylase
LKGNLDEFIKVVESEALTLHAMMTSMPYFILMKPNTEIINAIWKFRNDTKTPVCFTLDAGECPCFISENDSEKFCNLWDELVGFCQNGQYICDEIGNGSIQLV